MKKSFLSILSGILLLTCLSFTPIVQTVNASSNKEKISDGGGSPAPKPKCNNKGTCQGTN
ncbi:hypothetical protein [Heyndrickxia oleronia]|uniref:hypothetical protein n=1 Tax=Heyndrickxia oleronia TaxID=38875 RepID=UPI001B231321|nr:hypothetical protein [Heyndrickxia oleronia]GIN37900.1 hypothetical protein J19TS1_08490 [Heyndrickxia oleronia]